VSKNARKHAIDVCVIAVCILMSVSLVAQAVTQPVKVVNGTGQPVPTAAQGTTTVAGTVNVGNTPNVNVANTPTVTLSSGASVNVTNPPDSQGNPTPLATLEAVQVYGSHCAVSFGGNDSGSCAFTPIPYGKQLVVQEFDAFGRVETGNRPFELALARTITVGNYFTYTFMVNADGFDFLATHQETRVYVLQGSTPQCFVALPANSEGTYSCNISGFLVDVPLGEQPITAQDPKPLSQLLPKVPGR
jgi:hypothetical protein